MTKYLWHLSGQMTLESFGSYGPVSEFRGKESYKQKIKTGTGNQKASKTALKAFVIWSHRACEGEEPLI